MKKLITLSCLLLVAYAGISQTSVGVRGGAAGIGDGVSLKHFISEATAVEALLTFGENHLAVSAIYELHKGISDLDGLFLEYGAGPYVGFYDTNGNDEVRIGATGIIGLEYHITQIPVTISLDYNPSMQIIDAVDLDIVGVSASLRYVFRQ